MTTDDTKAATFEDRLLVELTNLVREDGADPLPNLVTRRRGVRRPVLLAGAAAAAAAVAAGIVVLPSVISGGHGAPKGYAVTKQPGGTIDFSVSGLISNTVSAQTALRAAGAGSVRVVSATAYSGRCHDSDRNLPMPQGLLRGAGPDSLIIDPARLPHGSVLILAVPTRSGVPEPVSASLSSDGTPPCH